MADLPELIANQANSQTNLASTTVDKSFIQTVVIISEAQVELWDMPTVIEDQNVDGYAIYGHTSFGIYGTSAYGGAGGGPGAYVINKIANPNNKFNWFATTEEVNILKHSTTNATINSTAQTISFTAGQKLVINCYRDDDSLLSGYVNCDNTILDTIGNYTFELSPNNGTTWYAVTNGTPYTFGVAGTHLLVRITCSTTGTITLKNSTTGVCYPIQVVYAV